MLMIELPENFYDCPQALQAGTLAIGYFVKVLSYAATHGTDGLVGTEALGILGADLAEYIDSQTPETIVTEKLVNANLLSEVNEGFQVIDWQKYCCDDGRELA